ncbi:hypothetical protein PoB_006697400 [Plakobranchus ocellatus]|uniref:Uncharacterized protein n=1 Tax=Plakobranchus ocellatus TaxID=259542 RepID=A0AAV4D8I4_9GAST|nr:hypothetical protein PoB_006697400 [Plakobranchus ocellatus]
MPSILIRSQLAKCYSFKNSLILTAPISIFYVARSSSRVYFYARYLNKECIQESCKLINAAGKNGIATSNHNFMLKSAIANIPPPGISIANAPIRHQQYHPPGIAKVNTPFRHI